MNCHLDVPQTDREFCVDQLEQFLKGLKCYTYFEQIPRDSIKQSVFSIVSYQLKFFSKHPSTYTESFLGFLKRIPQRILFSITCYSLVNISSNCFSNCHRIILNYIEQFDFRLQFCVFKRTL